MAGMVRGYHPLYKVFRRNVTLMIYLATDNGLVLCEQGDEWRILRRGLAGQRVTSLSAREDVILAGTTDGIFRSEDEGRAWVEARAGLGQRHIRWMAFHPDGSGLAFAGTEPADIFISRDAGKSWEACPEVARLRDEHGWFLPYSPEAGCVRGFAFHSGRGYAAVEVGGVLRSDDNGASWRLAEGSDGNPSLSGPPAPFIYPDVHSIHVHPSSPDLVDAPTGGGFYRSSDGGITWELLYDCYCRAVWTDPADPAHLILGPADGVSSNGRIEETRDGGRTWSMASNGLDVPWRRHMVERFAQIGSELFAILSNGEVLCAQLSALEWKRVLPTINYVNALAAIP
jgi:photosystem II stability/assembly factor-like uncharacterized protein